ncbi:hypothetical protein ACLQ2R_23005 [Streptosporangium sp. DT93]|uniref:hypothetical protein n=1 Tax=Streptosporangium sp. DT93 TaxID=3393428 RepID=UPI003CF6DCDB
MRTVIALVVLLAAACAPSEAEPFTPVDLSPGTSSPGSADGSSPDPAGTGPRVETVRVSPDVQVVVEWPAVTDRDTVEMIDAFRDYRAGSFRSVVTGGEDTAYYKVFHDEAVMEAYRWVKEFLRQRRSVRGVSRVYALNVVSVFEGKGAELRACVDETGMRLLDARTGKAVRRQPDWTRSPFLQIVGLRKGDDGVWRIKLLEHADPFSEGAKGCLR